MNANNPVRPAGTDGAYLRTAVTVYPQCGFRYEAWTHAAIHPGAELRPIARVDAWKPPAIVPRPAWPSYLALAAFVLAVDHGNVGAALLVGIWWAGWAVRR